MGKSNIENYYHYLKNYTGFIRFVHFHARLDINHSSLYLLVINFTLALQDSYHLTTQVPIRYWARKCDPQCHSIHFLLIYSHTGKRQSIIHRNVQSTRPPFLFSIATQPDKLSSLAEFQRPGDSFKL